VKPNVDIMGDFISPCGQFRLTFDDDGRVAYAYLKRGNDVVGDVWVYNRCVTPDAPEWTDRSKLPFANCEPFAKPEGNLLVPFTLDDVSVDWHYSENRPMARLYLFAELTAVIALGDKPGFSRFAAKDGPLARALV